MLDLDDARWPELAHAYGPASDTPALLKQLARMPGPKQSHRDEPWFTLWSSLCHQGDVYAASYAALPHIVRIGIEAPGPIASDFFQLPASIEVARAAGNGPPIPRYLWNAYHDSLAALVDCVATHIREQWDQPTLLSAAAALGVAKHQTRAASALLNLDDDGIAKLIGLDGSD